MFGNRRVTPCISMLATTLILSGTYFSSIALSASKPSVKLTSVPATSTPSTDASFAWTSRSATSTACTLDGVTTACASPHAETGLPAGSHSFRVTVYDERGRSASASHSWSISEPEAEAAPAPAPEPEPTPAVSPGVLFSDAFSGPDGIITSADAFWNPYDTTLARDPNWEGESGTMYRRAEAARSTTNITRVFRFWTTRSDFANVNVQMDLRTHFYHAGDLSMPAASWDGVKLWLRRQVINGTSSANVSPALYTAEVNRRQGNVVIQKKCTGQDSYTVLANTAWSGNPNPAKIGQWERVGGTVRTNADGSVTVQVIRDGAVVLTGTDNGAGGCAPITAAGKVGVRGDNTEFDFDNFTVTAG